MTKLVKRTRIWGGYKLAVLLAVAMAGSAVFGACYYHIPNGGTVGYWDDTNCWWNSTAYNTHVDKPKNDTHIMDAGVTIYVTNDVTSVWGTLYNFTINASATSAASILHVIEGGDVTISTLIPGNNANTHGTAIIDAGAMFRGSFTVGNSGFGVVTNSGAFRCEGNPTVGANAAGVGLWVHEDGTNSFPNPKNLTVGKNGIGDVLVRSGEFWWRYWQSGSNRIGYVFVGHGDGGGTGRITVEDGATFKAGRCRFGGDGANAGHGELILRGGTYINNFDNGEASVTFHIGAATNGMGGIRTDSYGTIRGWGKFMYANVNTQDGRNIHARLGNGVIEGDGEGVERTLDCSEMWQVTNVLFGVEMTNGWNAVNKGMVILPGVNAVVGTDGWGTYGGTNCVGCGKWLEKPDLINAVKIKAFRSFQRHGWNFGAAVLAADRSDAHASGLKRWWRPLGFWKAGTFSNRASWTTASCIPFTHATIDFRYDHRKLSGRPDSRIVVLRWDETSEKWNVIARYATPPADHVVSSGDMTTVSGDELYSLGLFCVAEDTTSGTVITFR